MDKQGDLSPYPFAFCIHLSRTSDKGFKLIADSIG